MNTLSIKKKRNLIYFIQATQDLMDEQGIDHVTIRGVATHAGYTAATIYRYFDDLDHLILFACLQYLSIYNTKVIAALRDVADTKKQFYITWDIFCDVSFQYPEAFERIFFGPHSDKLGEIYNEYNTLFPEQVAASVDGLSTVFLSLSLFERNKLVMQPILTTIYKTQRFNVMNELVVFAYEGLLRQHIRNLKEHRKDEPFNDKMKSFIDYVLSTKSISN